MLLEAPALLGGPSRFHTADVLPSILDLVAVSKGVAWIVLQAMQEKLLKLRFKSESHDREDRRERRRRGIAIEGRIACCCRIVALREAWMSTTKTAESGACSVVRIKRVTAMGRAG